MLGFFAHQLPAGWHQLESWAGAVGELLLPFAMFAGRAAAAGGGGHPQRVPADEPATANYGFFCYLALALHLFLLDDPQVERAQAALRGRLLARLPARFRRLRLRRGPGAASRRCSRCRPAAAVGPVAALAAVGLIAAPRRSR